MLRMREVELVLPPASQSPHELHPPAPSDAPGNEVQAPNNVATTACYTVLLGLLLWVYLRKDVRALRVWGGGTDRKAQAANSAPKLNDDRCIVQRMTSTNKDLVVFFGSQTGNSQDLAERLAKEGHSRFGLQTMVADLEEYDYETGSLNEFPQDKVAIFMLSSYGEGEPTDNAIQFFDFITGDGDATRLDSMQYAVFGLGNSTYEHYNLVARKVDASLTQRGAKRIGPIGEGDDGKGSTEDDFLAWKDAMWETMQSIMGLQEQYSAFEPSFTVSEVESLPESGPVFLGERSEDEIRGAKSSPSGLHNPSVIPIKNCYELFNSTDRSCLHVELDIQHSDLTYETGDHVAIWPMNSNEEVDRFLRVFGLLDKRHSTIHVSPVNGTSHQPIPTPTTYDAAVRYYLEIGGPVSRQFLQTMSEFAVEQEQQAAFAKLAKDKTYFAEVISSQLLNLAQLVERISPNNATCPIPFAVLIEGVRALQPRYYSISSSSRVGKDEVAITAVVESTKVAERWFKGVTTNYLLALKQKKHGEKPGSGQSSYALSGRQGKYELNVAAYIRQSHFKLPTDNTRPIIMVGPGTGVAPFRAFIHERAAQAKLGQLPGRMMLFYGCRKQTEDFVYGDEWKDCQKILGDRFTMHTAFSRETQKKIYVQDRIKEASLTVRSVLLDDRGCFYICGDTRMARQVQAVLCQILGEGMDNPHAGQSIVQRMKSEGRFQEDVW